MSEFVKVLGITEECYDTKTIEFQMDDKAVAGQFVMVWVPGAEEIPMSLSKTGRIKSITVKAIGDSTKKLHELTVGDSMRIRGPYGHGYDLRSDKKYLIIGGGVGTASIMPAVKDTAADVIIGARSQNDIILMDRAMKYSDNVWVSTDDGSYGFRGNAVQLMRQKCTEKKYDCIIGCGPEIMLYYLHQACVELDIDCQLSLERYMKCGAGVCGCCVMDGFRVCRDGPVFTRDQISNMGEFGTSKRDECGRLVKTR